MMSFKGSVVIKKIHILNMIENMKSMFRTHISRDSKYHLWGQRISYERILEGDISSTNWNDFMQTVFDLLNFDMRHGINFILGLENDS